MSVPKVLLIANCDLTGGGIGSIFLRDAISYYPSGRMLCYTTVPSRPQLEEMMVCGCRTFVRQAPFSRWPGLAGYVDRKFTRRMLGDYSREIEEIVRRESIDLVWAVLNSVSTIHLSHYAMNRIDVPLVCTEWDTPQYFALCLPLGLLPWSSICAEYRWLLQRAARVSVMSETGRRVFREQYGVDGIPWKHGVREEVRRPGVRMRGGKDDLRIGFAGSLYSKREWNALVKALDNAGWMVGGRNVQIHFIGRFPRLFAKRNAGVLEYGTQTFDRTKELLALMDVAYLPYWLGSKWSYVVRTAFPSKLSTYVAAGIPVFYHGPRDSSVSEFLQEYPIGLECDSLDSAEIVRCLERLAGDGDFLERAAKAREAALAGELGHDAMLTRFAQLMGIDRNQLTAAENDHACGVSCEAA
jgi:hypothetical protein